MTVLLFAGLYENHGTGNLIRQITLYRHLSKEPAITTIHLYSNDPATANRLIRDLNLTAIDMQLNSHYDVIVIDSPSDERRLLTQLSYTRSIALDCFHYEAAIDVFINLYNHNQQSIGRCKGEIKEGVQYAILRDEFLALESRTDYSSKEVCDVLISFGGEDPSSLTLHTLNSLKNHDRCRFTVIVGSLNKERETLLQMESETITVITMTNQMHTLMNAHDVIVCGGGTTLLEALYVGNPVIALPQNVHEKGFIDHIHSKIPLFGLDDFMYLLSHTNDRSFRQNLLNTYRILLDGKGKDRIMHLILKNQS